MFTEIITPRFSDTDALGHINNTMVPIWFEGARDPVFRLFMPELDTNNWQLILAKIDVSYHAQMFYGQALEVRTYISRIGGASFDVYQELWQNGAKCASGTAVMVHYCYQQQTSQTIADSVKETLLAHQFQAQ
ncbi:acyl-CoA thioesterase [Thalassotalea sp. PLHSN55]|uniref:acyl-CoA thioesterase n=1 Tax=Thalassotalea sp. PLHSN55 TaxID=3435888 RepID=UPI003F85EAED